jgi:hypothetical protein
MFKSICTSKQVVSMYPPQELKQVWKSRGYDSP